MELSYAELSSPGPVREENDDRLGFWQPPTPAQKRTLGGLAALAEGGGGQKKGALAGQLAVDRALNVFRDAKADCSPQQLLSRLFTAANLAVYEKTIEPDDGTMTASLCLAILRDDELVVGNAGSSRAYLVRDGDIRQLSRDDTYLGMQQKLGLVSEQEAETSEDRTVLTSSLGRRPSIRVEAESVKVRRGDCVILCSDGLYRHVSDRELSEYVSRLSPAQACRQLVSLAESRGTEDSVSIQVITINQLDDATREDEAPQQQQEPVKSNGYELQPGQTLDDRFLLTETISRSGMATIFKATDLLTNEDVAVKVPFLQFESDPGFYSRFAREGAIGEKLNHPYILKFIPVECRSRPYLVTEYLRGYTLAHLLKSVGPLPEKDAVRIVSRICEALAYMHEHGVIHRDLKPQNVMICFDGTIRILDFGIAKSTGRRFTFSGFTPAMGTPEYMAPEQVKGKRGDERTDLYSLGAMLYEMTVGVLPFASENGDVFVAMNARVTGDPLAPRKQNRQLSEQVEEVILHAMEREPRNRFASAVAMKEELDHPEKVELTGRWRRLQTPVPWKRYLKSGILLAVVLLAILIGFIELILLIIRRSP